MTIFQVSANGPFVRNLLPAALMVSGLNATAACGTDSAGVVNAGEGGGPPGAGGAQAIAGSSAGSIAAGGSSAAPGGGGASGSGGIPSIAGASSAAGSPTQPTAGSSNSTTGGATTGGSAGSGGVGGDTSSGGASEVEAERFAEENGIEVEGLAGETVRVAQIADGDWVAYSQVDFRNGATNLVAQVASGSAGGTIDVRIDGCIGGDPGTSIGTCEVADTGGLTTFAEVSCELAEATGPHDLCLAFSGSFELDSFHLE